MIAAGLHERAECHCAEQKRPGKYLMLDNVNPPARDCFKRRITPVDPRAPAQPGPRHEAKAEHEHDDCREVSEDVERDVQQLGLHDVAKGIIWREISVRRARALGIR